VLVVAAVVTGVLTALSKGTTPDPRVVAGYLVVIAGAALIAYLTTIAPSAVHATPAGAEA
jgi:UPF0716 family protein affecting phage T7 exclusion